MVTTRHKRLVWVLMKELSISGKQIDTGEALQQHVRQERWESTVGKYF